jgi:hypothetical protein
MVPEREWGGGRERGRGREGGRERGRGREGGRERGREGERERGGEGESERVRELGTLLGLKPQNGIHVAATGTATENASD